MAMAIVFGISNRAALGQTTPGVRHRIDAVVSAEPDAPILEHLRGRKGSLSFTVRLSANSRESRFYGLLDYAFSGVLVPRVGVVLLKQTKIWEEEKCHQRRGLPKATVTQLAGSFGEGEEKIEISAMRRHIGVLLSQDELTPGIKLDAAGQDGTVIFSLRAQSRKSHFNVDLQIHQIDCYL
ncbi:hypothetical protein [Bradyrhizobium sp. RDT46]|uniref:hypothetical protein n=1 Tax=Bradyrhizobium sp. RDT46 TaxID=3341829 RepID=UPI0035C66EA9